MSRYIDADALKEKINTAFWAEIGEIIDEAPSIDIVRCRDCKNYDDGEVEHDYDRCWHHWSAVEPDDFCSYGER